MEKKKAVKPKTGMARIFELAYKQKILLGLSGFLASVAAIASFVPYVAIYLIIKEILFVYPDFGAIDTGTVMKYGFLALAGIVTDVICFLFSSICAHIAAFGTQYELKSMFTKHLSRIPLGFHLTYGSGRFRKVIDQDIEKIEAFLAHSYPDMVASITAPVVMLVVLFVFDWRFGLASLAAIIAAFVLQMLTFGAAGPEVMKEMQRTTANMTEASVEYVRGMPVLKAFGQSARSFNQLFNSIREYTTVMLTYTLKWENYTAGFMAVINNIYLFLLPVGIMIGRRTNDYISFVLSFIFYLLFTPAIASVLNKLMYVSSSSMRISGGVDNFDTMMKIPELTAPVHFQKAENYNIQFQNVFFSYTDGDKDALTDVSFIAKQGEFTAIVGPSGSGKSTIAHLIPRFWEVSKGSIRIGDSDIRNMPEEELMQCVSFVFQDVYLFGQSIKDNIRMGCLNATDEEIIQAAKAAKCDEFISCLPQGYDTIIGEKGIHFSGGEAQRISIARAIIKNAPIIVLDEATAFADPVNERMIQEALAVLVKGKTVIMIAHRLGTIRSADKIIVMEKGHIVEEGAHDVLLNKSGEYTRMWKHYSQAVSWKVGIEKEGIAHEYV